MSFSDLGLSKDVLGGVKAKGYHTPTLVQRRAVPVILEGRDVIGSAQTGTGKTAAFALPLLSLLGAPQPKPRVLVMEPTRELALQVQTAFKDYGRYTKLRSVSVYGGKNIIQQKRELSRGADIIIGTPGRLLDLVEQKSLKLGAVQYLVLDEADRMLDMGFLPTVKKIVEFCREERQTLLFSATMPAKMLKFAQWAMKTPEEISVGERHTPAENVRHVMYPVAESQKVALLRALLDTLTKETVVIFCKTRARADRVTMLLERNQRSVAVIHSDKSQRERELTLEGFREGKFKILVATDIASRGLDIPQVSHVINFDVPLNPEVYVHRIGRTGRAEAKGDAFTLVVKEELVRLKAIETLVGQTIPRAKLEGFDYVPTKGFSTSDDDKAAKPKGQKKPRRKVKRLRVTGKGYFQKKTRNPRFMRS